MPGLQVVGRAFLVLFAISTAFPFLGWFLFQYGISEMGIVDVGIASFTVVAAFTLEGRARPFVTEADRARSWLIIRAGATGLLLLLGIFFIAPTQFHWDVLVIGLVWRAWLLIWVLPSLVASLRQPR